MPRKRNKENIGLPSRWRYIRNAYYYQVPPGSEHLWCGKKTYKLGRTLPEAYKVWADKIEIKNDIVNFNQLFDKYLSEVAPLKAPRTCKENLREPKVLRKVFGELNIKNLKPSHVYKYHEISASKSSAKHEIRLLSHTLTKAVEWGVIDSHPFKGQVVLPNNKPRTRYIEDWEIQEALSLSSSFKKGSVKVLQVYICIKIIIGLRKSDMLSIKLEDLREEGLYSKNSKTGKEVIFTWTDTLRKLVDTAFEERPNQSSEYLFCNRQAKPYFNRYKETSGFNSMWQRFMKRLLEETKVKDRFTEHDLRAKAGSDAIDDNYAQKLLTHSNLSLTKRTYRRKIEIINPIK